MRNLFIVFFFSVMRLSRPALYTPIILDCDPWDLPGDLFNNQLKSDISLNPDIPNLAVGSTLTLPQSFGYCLETYINSFQFLNCLLGQYTWGRRFPATSEFKITALKLSVMF